MKKINFTIILFLTFKASFSQIIIQMKKEGGVSIIPCKVNGLNLSFIFDTGASDVTISLTEASFMLKNGYLKKDDFNGSEKYLDATGSISEGIIINLREIEIEGLVLHDVKASIVKTLNALLLLGQSALSKLGTIKLDLDKNQLTIETFSKSQSTVNEKTIAAKTNLNAYKKAFIILTQILNGTSFDFNELSKYYSLNNVDIYDDEHFASPFQEYKTYNATSYYYTFNKNKTLLESIAHLQEFSKDKGINWALFDSSSVVIESFRDDELRYSFDCDGKQYSMLTAFDNLTINRIEPVKIYLPNKIDSKTFFNFRIRVSNELPNYTYSEEENKFLNETYSEDYSEDETLSFVYFYDNLIYRLESYYNDLSFSDKNLFSTIDFEPAYWCERSAGLQSGLGIDNLSRRMSLYSKGISLYEKYLYPKMKETLHVAYLYDYRGDCKYKSEDYSSAYEDYKKGN